MNEKRVITTEEKIDGYISVLKFLGKLALPFAVVFVIYRVYGQTSGVWALVAFFCFVGGYSLGEQNK
jgi:hypothetical protein